MALTNIKTIQNSTQVDLLNYFYPVGTTYMTLDSNFDPNTTWGGTWVQIKDRFLYATSDSSCIGTCDGSSTATLKTCNLPSISGNTESFTCLFKGYACDGVKGNITKYYWSPTCCCYTYKCTIPPMFGNCSYVKYCTCCYCLYNSSWKYNCVANIGFLSASYNPSNCQTTSINTIPLYTSCPIYTYVTFPQINIYGGCSCPVSIMPPYLNIYAWYRSA